MTSQAKPVVVGVGELLWDCFPGKTPLLGGATANVAFHAAQLGAKGIVVSRVGSDAHGERAVSVLQNLPMPTAYIQRDASHPTGTVDVALSAGGQPTYTIHENVAWDFIGWDAAFETLASQTSAVVWGSLAQRSPVSQNTIRRFVANAPADAVRLFDVNLRQHYYCANVLRESLTAASVLKLNDDELSVLSRTLDLPTDHADAVRTLIADFGLSLVALTRGANGAELYPASGSVVRVAPVPVQVVDTVGAGDAFTAALLVGLLRGDVSLAEVGKWANRVGGYVAGQHGATPLFPAELVAEAGRAMSDKAFVPFGVSEFTTGPNWTLAQDVALLQDLHIPYIELCEGKLDPDPNRAANELRFLADSGLQVSSVQPRLHSLFPDVPRPVPVSPQERMARLEKSIQRIAPFFPGTTFVTITGAAPHANFDVAYETAAREYAKIARIAEENGVRIALEPLNPILMNADTFLCSLAHAVRVMEAVNHPAFGLWVDVWHVWEDTDTPRLIAHHGKQIFGVHVNDWRTPRAFGDRLLPGDGVIPLVPLLRVVHQAGYEGAYTLEIFSEYALPGSLWADPKQTVTHGQAAFTRLWEQVVCG